MNADPATRPTPDWDPSLAAPVSAAAEISRIELVSCYFTRRDPDGPIWGLAFDDSSVDFGVTGFHKIVEQRDGSRDLCTVLTFEASIDDPDVPEDELPGPFFLGAAFRAVYSLGEADLSEAAVECFAYWNGLLTLWPYWRELASSMSDRAGFDLKVPIFRVPAS